MDGWEVFFCWTKCDWAFPQGSSGTSGSGRDTSGQMVSMEDLQVQLENSLKHLHQKELRVQHLNNKLSQVFEEKNALALQLRGSSRSLRESHQQHSEALSRCAALEKQLQEWQGPAKTTGPLLTDAAPGAPQEKDETNARELQDLQAHDRSKATTALGKKGLMAVLHTALVASREGPAIKSQRFGNRLVSMTVAASLGSHDRSPFHDLPASEANEGSQNQLNNPVT
ncbi:golgin subfamily B member 1-like [Pseudonaja textilis]|uniref:golgin subfamily B member 1-like n=1 Tax=Pseudonaja textilis TaxID=8673 RepID=UPI000EAA0D12|nr:golgin subfamily B member 1-like [Pseudonaja textilis]